MNCDLVGLIEHKYFKSDKKMRHLIELNGRKLNAEEVRMVVRAAVKAGYRELYEVPDEFAEEILKRETNE